ncbi:Clavaminate synthase-like protein [Lizonia empirigonia]|nr:Clavaminate synthase-like protein [Lizonia empirigonia]
MAVYDMDDALHRARSRHTTEPPTNHSPNPTPESSKRDDHPIATAQESGLPNIDISPFLDPAAPAPARQATAAAINAACTNYGFFYLTGHGIPEAELDQIIDLARRFFALPLREKEKIKRFDAGGPQGGDSARGYQGLGENVTGGLQDVQEAVDFYRPWDPEKVEVGDGGPGTRKTLQGPNLWPEEPRELREVYEKYIERVTDVGRALVSAMGVALGLGRGTAADVDASTEDEDEVEDENVFLRHCNESFWVMRMINYPPLPSTTEVNPTTTPSQFSCGAHTDYGCVTLLLTDSTPNALQVRLKNGTWLPAPPRRGAFVVNIGDMIERWTNGAWTSTLHRNVGRISIPFFFEPNFDAHIAPLARCVRASGQPPVHRGSSYGEHLLTKVFSNFYYSRRTDW